VLQYTVCCKCSVLQSTAVCCSVLQCAAVCCSALPCAAVCCSMLPSVAVCCSVLQCVAVHYIVLQCIAVCCRALQCVAVCCSMLPSVAVCCSALHCVAVYCLVLQCAERKCNVLQYAAVGPLNLKECHSFSCCILIPNFILPLRYVTRRPNTLYLGEHCNQGGWNLYPYECIGTSTYNASEGGLKESTYVYVYVYVYVKGYICMYICMYMYIYLSSMGRGFGMQDDVVRVAKTHRMPEVVGHFSQKSHYL